MKSQSLSDLSRLRMDWDTIQEIELCFFREMTARESLEVLLQLQKAFKHQLKQTESMFASKRRAALINLLDRLRSLIL